MGLATRIGLAVLLVGATFAAASASTAGERGSAAVQVAKVKGKSAKGLVVATRSGGAVKVIVSLHGMPTGGGEYAIAGASRRCSVDGSDFVVWRVGIIMANTEGDAFRQRRARLQARFGSVRSVRVIDESGEQVACGRVIAR